MCDAGGLKGPNVRSAVIVGDDPVRNGSRYVEPLVVGT
jgi:hypothetical protein